MTQYKSKRDDVLSVRQCVESTGEQSRVNHTNIGRGLGKETVPRESRQGIVQVTDNCGLVDEE